MSEVLIMEQKSKVAKTLLERVSALHAGFGYTIAQWLLDHDYNNISICIESGENRDSYFEELVRAVTLPIKMNPDVNVNNLFTSSEGGRKQLTHTFKLYFSKDVYRPLELSKIKSGELFIHISISENGKNARIRNSIETIGAKYILLTDLINKALNYVALEAPILRVINDNPGVKAMRVTLPQIRQDKSESSKSIFDNDVTFPSNVAALKAGNRESIRLCDYIKNEEGVTDEEWVDMVSMLSTTSHINEKGHRVIDDKSGKYVNVIDGHRQTAYQPEEYNNSIYVFGGCPIFGVYCSDEQTLASQLQRIINQNQSGNGKIYRVENYGHHLNDNWRYFNRIVSSIKPKMDDIIILAINEHVFFGDEMENDIFKIPELDLTRIELPGDQGILFCDHTGAGHPSPNLHRFCAEKIYEYLQDSSYLLDFPQEYKYKTKQIPLCGLQLGNNGTRIGFQSEFSEKLTAYKKSLREIKDQTLGKVGAIVVNCNPFTLGHRYLIEYASERVRHLFIFVVEEDRSEFPFNDRLALVKEGTADLSNVTVLPSGEFIISRLTFSEYFNKASIQEQEVDPTLDVEIFATEIAPALGITVRFVGEEPLDKITNQYNKTMKKILPEHGIEFDIIPRKEMEGVISASRVRKLLENRDFETISKLVPITTFDYLRERYL